MLVVVRATARAFSKPAFSHSGRAKENLLLACAMSHRAAAAAPASAAAPPARRVLVVGGGFAGLAAARTLTQLAGQRCEVVVLEAGSEPGGRARTLRTSADLAIELGATWLHGLGSAEEPNPVFQHALEFGAITRKPKGG